MNQKLLALYGLKWNPFTSEVPIEALHVPPKVENFCWRIEQAHLREGGFALIHGDPGSGKSVVMRLLAERLARLADLSVGVIHHPQSNLSDFYRELGDIFSISIRVSNRWGGFKALRARWLDHLGSARPRELLGVRPWPNRNPRRLAVDVVRPVIVREDGVEPAEGNCADVGSRCQRRPGHFHCRRAWRVRSVGRERQSDGVHRRC